MGKIVIGIMRKLTRTIFCLLLISGPVQSATIPAYQAVYDALYGETLGGQLTEVYQVKEGEYHLESKLVASGVAALFSKGDIQQVSNGRIEDGSPKPAEYQYEQGKNKNYRFLFGSEQITIIGHKDRQSLNPEPLLLDELSLMLEIRLRLAQNIMRGKIPAIYGSKARNYLYQFQMTGEEKVETDLGSFDSLRIERTSSRGKYRYQFWCAPELDYLPVKIKRTDNNGRAATLVLKKYQLEKMAGD